MRYITPFVFPALPCAMVPLEGEISMVEVLRSCDRTSDWGLDNDDCVHAQVSVHYFLCLTAVNIVCQEMVGEVIISRKVEADILKREKVLNVPIRLMFQISLCSHAIISAYSYISLTWQH